MMDQSVDPGIYPALMVAGKDGHNREPEEVVLQLAQGEGQDLGLEGGDLHPDQVKLIADRLGVTEKDVVDMNRRLGGDDSLNTSIRDEGESGEWQDWLVDESSSQERLLLEREELDNRRQALGEALTVLDNRERRIFEARRLAEKPITLGELAEEFGVSRERVRQIEVRVFEKVEKGVRHWGAATRH
jgi:RNA polymerase sigma-32 factor